MENLPDAPKESIYYEDEKLYICLALYPITHGHSIVVWKEKCGDLHLLNKEDYEYLMQVVDKARNALLQKYNLEKVYLMYMDEVKQVHWHLIPRYDKEGYNLLQHKPEKTNNFSDRDDLEKIFNSEILPS